MRGILDIDQNRNYMYTAKNGEIDSEEAKENK